MLGKQKTVNTVIRLIVGRGWGQGPQHSQSLHSWFGHIPGLKVESIKFWSLWEENKLIGCGALKFLEENHGEFKSIRVVDEFRKKGYGIKILEHLITEAKKLKIKKLSLETGSGDFFIPARALFKKLGFVECNPFAHYKKDPNSCYMSLEI